MSRIRAFTWAVAVALAFVVGIGLFAVLMNKLTTTAPPEQLLTTMTPGPKDPIFHRGGIYGWDPGTGHWYFVGPDTTWVPSGAHTHTFSDTLELLTASRRLDDDYLIRTRVFAVLEIIKDELF